MNTYTSKGEKLQYFIPRIRRSNKRMKQEHMKQEQCCHSL